MMATFPTQLTNYYGALYPTYNPYVSYMPPVTSSAMASPLSQPTDVTSSAPSILPLVNNQRLVHTQKPQSRDTELTLMIPFNPQYGPAYQLVGQSFIEGSANNKRWIQQLQNQGYYVGAGSTSSHLVLSVSGPKGSENALAPLLMQLLMNSQLDPQALQNAKEDSIKSLGQQQQEPQQLLHEAVQKQLYGPGNIFSMGTPELIQQFQQINPATQQTTITQLQQWALSQGTWVATSDNNQATLHQSINESLQRYLPSLNPMMPAPSRITPPQKHVRQQTVFLPNENTPYAHIEQSWKAPHESSPDYPAFMVLRNILNSRSWGFFDVLRVQKHLVYGTDQSYYSRHGAADYAVSFQVDPQKIGQGIDGINHVIAMACQGQFAPADLEAAKKSAVLALRQSSETSDDLNAWVTTQLSKNPHQLPSPDTLADNIQKVRLSDVIRVANTMFDTHRAQTVLGVSASQHALTQFQQQRQQQHKSRKSA